MTVTLSAVAVPGLADGEGAGVALAELVWVIEVGGVETASCAGTMFVSKNSVANPIENFFMKVGCR